MLIFDIGANVGTYTIANNVNDNKFITVEASPNTFNTLIQNLSNYNNVTLLNYAVSNQTTDYVTFYEAESSVLSTMDLNWLQSSNSRFCGSKYTEIQVKTITLDKLIELYGIPDLCKIDVEGSEESVIKSLSKKVPILSFEWASEWKKSIEEGIKHLVLIGFTQFHVQYQDRYTYMPAKFELTSSECIDIINNSKEKVEWGMIWAR